VNNYKHNSATHFCLVYLASAIAIVNLMGTADTPRPWHSVDD